MHRCAALAPMSRENQAWIVSHSPIDSVAEHLTEIVELRLSAFTDGDDA